MLLRDQERKKKFMHGFRINQYGYCTQNLTLGIGHGHHCDILTIQLLFQFSFFHLETMIVRTLLNKQCAGKSHRNLTYGMQDTNTALVLLS